MHHVDRMEKDRNVCGEHTMHPGLSAHCDAVGVDVILNQKLINKGTEA